MLDPDRPVRDYSEYIREAEAAVAQTIGNLRMAEDDHARAVNDANSWGNKAIAASRKADEFRAAGNSVDAVKFDTLARLALQRQVTAESTAKAQELGLAVQNEVVDKLKGGLDQMRGKLHELTAKRNQLVNRSRVAAAQSQVHDALKSDLCDRPVRGQHPPPGGHGPRPAGARRLIPGGQVRLPGRPRRADRSGSTACRAQVHRT
jgi:phage shock protein A